MAILDGYKTYIFAAAMALVSFAKYLGWITPDAATAIEGVLLGGGIAALRAGIKKA
jgi:hypothetical protein